MNKTAIFIVLILAVATIFSAGCSKTTPKNTDVNPATTSNTANAAAGTGDISTDVGTTPPEDLGNLDSTPVSTDVPQ